MILLHILTSLLFALHPFHVSVMSVDHSPEEQSLQITLKLFADDLEEAMNKPAFKPANQPYIDVLNPPDEQQLNKNIDRYLSEHLLLTVNGEVVHAQFLGKEIEELAMWCYLEAKAVNKIEHLTVKSTIMTDTFDDQVNIVHVNYQQQTKSMKLAGDRLLDEVFFSTDED